MPKASAPATQPQNRIRQRQQEESATEQQGQPKPGNSADASVPPAAPTAKLLVHDLHFNVEEIYRDTLQRLCGPQVVISATTSSAAAAAADKKKRSTSGDSSNAAHFFVDDNESATMLIRFPDKASAKRLAHRLHHAQLYGTQVEAFAVPTASLQPTYNPCGVKITEIWVPVAAAGAARQPGGDAPSSSSLKFSLHELQQYLSANPGFLGVTDVTSSSKKSGGKRVFIATYADSGAALQARALMSGRAFHGSHLLFERVKADEVL